MSERVEKPAPAINRAATVAARCVESVFAISWWAGHRHYAEPGAFSWEASGAMLIACPGCGAVQHLPVFTGDTGGGWKWDGNRNAPTLHPSIWHDKDGICSWHGFLQAGVFRSC